MTGIDDLSTACRRQWCDECEDTRCVHGCHDDDDDWERDEW